MRMRLFTFLVAFAVLWGGTGGPSLACSVEGPANILVAVDAIDQVTPGNQDETERQTRLGTRLGITIAARRQMPLTSPLQFCLH